MERRLLGPAVIHPSHSVCYRERIYIIKDILLKLVEYGELNQTALMSFCGLNLSKHRSIIEEMEHRNLIIRETITTGRRKSMSVFRPTQIGIEFCRDILEPFEMMFQRKKIVASNESNHEGNRREVENIGM